MTDWTDIRRLPPYIIRESTLDGLREVSWPPHDSYDRYRETFMAYPDCADCQGLGVSGRGPDYRYIRCAACADRHHPVRHWYTARMTHLYKAGEARFQRRLAQAAGVTSRTSKKKAAQLVAELDEDVTARIRAEVLVDYRRIEARFRAYADPIIGDWIDPETGEKWVSAFHRAPTTVVAT